ncbi:alpha/beta-hydrolase [Auriscalpium vulgare]|uniref:Alpha/beta-hydrolase n=2 Tax=Auriscalpium vulgare TaxID=40419 RepID=A0ACB8R1Q9_9AGAM|nr:alpha/beta-hydrolase [Auriscalpium vulgare]KAI0042488.1 alpha/beta-hydrolase [Auriscalpium vulgare]
MTAILDKYGRISLDVASAATSLGFAAAKAGTRLGFGITRGIASSAAGLTGSALELAFGGYLGTSEGLGNAVASAITAIEKLALLPIVLGENLTSASIVAAYSSMNAFGSIFPGSDETSFSLASFITLVRREWNEPLLGEHLPEEHYSVMEVARALVAWGALQGVTYDWQVKQWKKHLREIPFHDESQSAFHTRQRAESRVSITSDVLLAGKKGHIITADITELDSDTDTSSSTATRLGVPNAPTKKPLRVPNSELKHTLRRLSKLVLAGYGGASLLFFGVSPTPAASPAHDASIRGETETLERAVDASESQAPATQSPGLTQEAYSWWNVLLGRHDHEIFMGYAKSHLHDPAKQARPLTAVIGDEERMPRFWVLTDHARRQIVLVFRGTMSLNELAVDLTCEVDDFEPAGGEESVDGPTDDAEIPSAVPEEGEATEAEESVMPGSLPFPTIHSRPASMRWNPRRMRTASFMSIASFATEDTYKVHGGMLKMAQAMGGHGKPVHIAVKDALRKNKGYELVMSGHSLGSGVAALLGLMWADPKTCLTVRSSGLPVGRRVSVFCFGPPCLTDARLAKLSANLITSFVYSHDVVSRLSLGSIRDMNRAAAWLCKANAEGSEEGHSGVTRRALKWKTGFGGPDDPVWFLAMRKTLEANMPMQNLYPPGRVMWAMRDGDMEAAPLASGDKKYSAEHVPPETPDKLRLFEVLDIERVFSQVVFARDMLSAHLPHQYDKVLEELL